jgi:CRISPR-associated endonuclease/helicase Cas3
MNSVTPTPAIARLEDLRILTLRGQSVVLDSDLARLYGVSTTAFNQAIKRNRHRFPKDFAFDLNREEFGALRSQIAASTPSGAVAGRYAPWGFAEHGALMAATVLNSARAVAMSHYVIHAFARMRRKLQTTASLEARLAEIERTLVGHDAALKDLYRKLKPLLLPPAPRREIGFHEFFKAATEHTRFDYQRRLAGGNEGCKCESKLINVPTGLGKTAAVVLAWLYNRVALGRSDWPRRLVYCLPMRTLVEQTQDNAFEWLVRLAYAAAPDDGLVAKTRTQLSEEAQERLRRDAAELRRHTGWLAGARSDLLWLVQHSPVILMGGEEADQEWDIHPERPCILIGTQDMLLSRALNRGYGMSRYRWPMHFGLLNNDCLWVMDETQLMGVSLETSLQLAGFRERFGTLVHCVHWWMSATLDEARLKTPEAPSAPAPFQLTDPEKQLPEVRRRWDASKRLLRAMTALAEDPAAYARALTGELLSSHVTGTLSLVIVNTVERAQAVFRELQKQAQDIPATLLHSRFRPFERQALVRRVLESSRDRIVVSTQVIEAGVDLSARTLFTELAPWSSLVQRFGRCHRHGEMPDTGADIHWIDLPDTEAAPYLPEQLNAARQLLAGLTNASPATLGTVTPPPAPETQRHVILPKDLRELFDTTPDIAGADLDISRYIREAEDSDCLAFWRAAEPHADSEGPARDELCPVPVGQLRELAEKQKDKAIWVWDALAGQWTHPDRFIPGRTYWLLSSLGGYDPATGFDRRSKGDVPPVQQPAPPPETHDDERGTTLPHVETLEQHTSAVVTRAAELASAIGLPANLRDALARAAQWHDVGKAHPVFQAALRRANPALDAAVLCAKSGSKTRLIFEGRPHFRHELASALGFRALAAKSSGHGPLVAYLIAAHHGKVRLSIRSLPGESEPPRPPDGGDPLFARGVWQGDTLPPFNLEGADWPAVTLSLAPMQIGLGPDGEPSWLESCLALRDSPDLGPFRLAYLETLLRAADARASREGLAATKPVSRSGVSSGMELREEPASHDSAEVLTPAEKSLVADLVADGLSIQDKFRPEPLYKQTGKGHYVSDTVEEVRRAKETKPKGDQR